MNDIVPTAWHGFWDFIKRHDVTLDLIVVWSLCLGSGIMGVAKLIAWWTLRGTQDAGMIGQSLKKQKLSEAFFWFGLATLYAMTLVSFYFAHQFGPPERTALRFGLMLAIVVSIFYVSRFIYFLRWGDPMETKNHRDTRQEATDVRQDARDVTQDARERRLWKRRP